MVRTTSKVRRAAASIGQALAIGALAAAPAGAQTYPAKIIRMIVPFAPGGNTDIIARAISQKMTEDLGQQLSAK
jgi:tripartite-type tricarboxylate transporter receptor subunit TctC